MILSTIIQFLVECWQIALAYNLKQIDWCDNRNKNQYLSIINYLPISSFSEERTFNRKHVKFSDRILNRSYKLFLTLEKILNKLYFLYVFLRLWMKLFDTKINFSTLYLSFEKLGQTTLKVDWFSLSKTFKIKQCKSWSSWN